jgi:hypothetical protein
MSWRNSITQIKKPKVLIQKESAWKKSIVAIAKDGKDFNFEENKEKINALVKKHIDSIHPQLKGKQGNPGKNGVGEKGRDGSTWLFSEETPDKEIGIDGDFCLCEDGDVYHKSAGEWVKRLSLKGKDAKTQYIGGGVTQATVEALIAEAISGSGSGHTIKDEGSALPQRANINFVGAGVAATDDAANDATKITVSGGGGGGGTATNIVSTTANMTVTDETHVIVKGINPLTISLKAIASATEPVSISNKSSENCTVDIDGGGTISDVVDDTELIIVPGNTYIFLPETGVAYHVT